VNPSEAETEPEEMFVGVLLAVLPFLNPILGNDLVVVSRSEAMGRMSRQRREAKVVPRHKIEIQAEIRSRYASTLVTHTVENPDSESKEVSFNLLLPDTAFVSRFAMVIGEEVFLAEVQEKKQALETYNEAVSKGQSAGHVALSARDSNQFSISANAEAGVKVQFHLLYEELLQRRSGLYHYQTHLNPPPSLQSLSLEVMVEEQRNLTQVAVPTIRDNSLEGEEKMVEEVEMLREGPGRARVTYRPNMKDLEKLGKSVQFLLEYDVERVDGEVLLMDGHFVHFLAPDLLPVLKQHVVFVIDSSGSMSGRKMEQTKNAMAAILGQIGPTDFFSIIDFDSDVKDVLIATKGTQKNIAEAVEAVNNIEAGGSTNIRDALLRSLEIVDQAEMKELQPLIIFLTDGQPSEGVTNPTQIQADVAARNRRGLAIFSLAFGTGADFEMLQKLSLQNHGFARKIYEGGDAAIQLQGFYREVASPLLSGVNFTYVGDAVEETSLTETTFHTFFKGSEMVVSGKLTGSEGTRFEYSVEGSGRQAYVCSYTQNGHEVKSVPLLTSRPMDTFLEVARQTKSQGFLERLWAFLRVRELLNKMDATEDEAAKEKALELALKYGFVTRLTSLVVVRKAKGQEVGQDKEETMDYEYDSGSGLGQHFDSNMVPHSTSNSFNHKVRKFANLSSGVQHLDSTWSIFVAFLYCLKFDWFVFNV